MNELNECAHTYELLNHIWWWCSFFYDFISLLNKQNISNKFSIYIRQASLKVFLQYPLYVTKDKNWQRCTPHDMASMDDESSDSPHKKKKPVESTFLGLRALLPTTVETCRTKRRPWRRDDVIRDCRESGRRGEMSASERERRKARHVYQLADIKVLTPSTLHWITHDKKRATTL